MRDPRVDPRPGDVVRDGKKTYEVIHRTCGQVCHIFRCRRKFVSYDSCTLQDWIYASQDNEVLHVAD